MVVVLVMLPEPAAGNEIGVGKLFPPGTTTTDIAIYIKQWVQAHRHF